MAPFPGIPDDALAQVEEPNPFDLAELEQAVREFADPPDAPLATLVEYGRCLLAANTVARLTGARDWDALAAHFVDCVRAAAFVPDDARLLADWGSGGGMPGLIWAVLFPEKSILLIEKNGKKAAFLEEAAMRLELFNIGVGKGQGEQVLKHEERPDLMVVRAVEPLAKLLERLRRNKIQPRSLFLMQGPNWREQWDEMDERLQKRWALTARHRYSLPGDLGERHLVVLKPR